MKNLNDFIKENTNLDNLSATELMQRFIQSTLYLIKKDIEPSFYGNSIINNKIEANVVGVFLHSKWYLSI